MTANIRSYSIACMGESKNAFQQALWRNASKMMDKVDINPDMKPFSTEKYG